MEEQFAKGQRVRLNERGRTYYKDDVTNTRQNLVGIVTYTNAAITYVRPDGGGAVVIVYTNCITLSPSDDEVAEAIESITQTPRRGQ